MPLRLSVCFRNLSVREDTAILYINQLYLTTASNCESIRLSFQGKYLASLSEKKELQLRNSP